MTYYKEVNLNYILKNYKILLERNHMELILSYCVFTENFKNSEIKQSSLGIDSNQNNICIL